MIVVPVMVGAAIMVNRWMTGLSRLVIEGLVAELAPRWQARHRDRLAARTCRRGIGAGAKHRFAFRDRLLATLVHLRHGLTHDVVAAWFGVHRSTITRSVAEVRLTGRKEWAVVAGSGRLRLCWRRGAGRRRGVRGSRERESRATAGAVLEAQLGRHQAPGALRVTTRVCLGVP